MTFPAKHIEGLTVLPNPSRSRSKVFFTVLIAPLRNVPQIPR